MAIVSFWKALKRCKVLKENDNEIQLARVLNVLDLTALGVGSTLGLGVYVLAGSVAKTIAGPAVCLSFLVAAVASAFAGFCYAEFAARVPKAGSAYVYSYVSVGEFIAFTIGWNLILEYVIGTAGVAKGMSNYIDALTGNAMKNFFLEHMPMKIGFMAEYPDFFAFFLVLVITALLAVGVKESTRLNNVFTALNLVTVIIVVVAGSIKADVSNWSIPIENITEEYRPYAGAGGFMPFGLSGVMAGAAKCFFGFVGFDCVATTGEEAINPKRSIPLSIVLSLIIIFISYFSISTVLTMMWPYYLQDADAPFPHVFEETGMHVIKWIVTVGAIFALCTSLLGAMFPLPRVLYAMGNDGVLFRPLAKINSKTLTPILATILSGILSGIMASMFDLIQLIDMMSIGTLMAYTIVAISVLVLRYKEEDEEPTKSNGTNHEQSLDHHPQNAQFSITPWKVFKQMFNLNGIKKPYELSSDITKFSIFIFFLVTLAFCSSLVWAYGSTWTVTIIIFGIMMIVTWVIITRQPMQDVDLSFKVPFVPLLPCVSIFMNLYLMVQLDFQTWVRFIVWLVVGYLIYFCYGIRHSSESDSYKEKHRKSSKVMGVCVISGRPSDISKQSTKF
ncbi:cationic amino acid transporter slimfast [Arctopsyche grandis]|uniref:cationic amino acid transporter slimfast n=1 Tax=Arctopsyche grandis TaxID=121162 RepID=UPI00406D8C96